MQHLAAGDATRIRCLDQTLLEEARLVELLQRKHDQALVCRYAQFAGNESREVLNGVSAIAIPPRRGRGSTEHVKALTQLVIRHYLFAHLLYQKPCTSRTRFRHASPRRLTRNPDAVALRNRGAIMDRG